MQKRNKLILTEEQMNLLKDFQKDFLTFNSHTNLISKNDESVIFEKHILDSLSLKYFLERQYSIETEIKLLDAGTGGGFPALPLAFCFKNLEITAIDSINKKISFIQSIKEKYNLKNIHPLCARMEELQSTNKEAFNIGVSRALAKINVLAEYILPYLKIGGFLVAYKSKLAQEELLEAENALKILGGKFIEKISYSTTDDDTERNLIIIQKIKKTPASYPRTNGLPKKSPL